MLSFLPKYIFQQITDISPEFLHSHGIRLLLMDYDNTMVPYTQNRPTPQLLKWLEEMELAGIQLCIVSNTNAARVPEFSEKHGIACIIRAGKPRPKGIRQALRQFSAAPEQTAMVGDQIYTDVLAANLAGVCSIAVASIHNHNFWLKLRHLFEIPLLALAKKRRVKE